MDPFHSDQVSLAINATCPRRSKFDNISTLIQSLNVWHTHPDNVVKYSFRVTLLICPIVNLGHNFEFQRIFLHSAQRSTHLQNLQVHKYKNIKYQIVIKRIEEIKSTISWERQYHVVPLISVKTHLNCFIDTSICVFSSSTFVNAEDEKSRNKKLSRPLEEGRTTCFHS